MSRLPSTLLLCAGVLIGALPLAAQSDDSGKMPAAKPSAAPRVRVSPHETIGLGTADGNLVMIVYGRPYSKDPKTGEIRKIWGGLIGGPINPWGHPWRAGADEATLFVTLKPILLGGTPVPAGAYTLFMVPAADGSAKLVVNKRIGEWGIPYPKALEAQELARIGLKRDSLEDNLDQFTIDLAKEGEGGRLEIKWEKTQYSVPYGLQQ